MSQQWSEVPGSSLPLSAVKADLFEAMAYPARVRVLEFLVDGERSVAELQPRVGIEMSHLSQQLGVLREAGLVTGRMDGSSVFYALRDPLVAEVLLAAKRLLLATLSQTEYILAGLAGPSWTRGPGDDGPPRST
jgi:DNA-binding transcriptional ArsR family regulator